MNSIATMVLPAGAPREEWLAKRREGIGSSDAPAVLGISPFSSPLKVYAEKIGAMEDREASEAMKWGHLLEPLIVSEFGKEVNRPVQMDGSLIRSGSTPFLQATLDAMQSKSAGDPGVLEVKATGFRAGDWKEGVPRHVFAQVQHQLAVTGLDWGSVAVLLNGCSLKWADVERDQSFIDMMLEHEEKFWKRVVERMPPEPDGTEASKDALKFLYPKDTGKVITLPGAFIELDDELQEAKAEEKRVNAKLDLLKQRFAHALGDASEGVMANGVSYTYHLQERDGYAVKPTSFRVLRRKGAK